MGTRGAKVVMPVADHRARRGSEILMCDDVRHQRPLVIERSREIGSVLRGKMAVQSEVSEDSPRVHGGLRRA